MEFLAGLTHIQPFIGSPLVHSVSSVVASTLIASVWQSGLIAAGLALALKVAPRASARTRFMLWAGAFGAVLVLPFLPWLTQGLHPASGMLSWSGQPQSRPLLVIDIRWSIAIACLWAFASLYRAADLLRHAFRLRKLWKTAMPIKSAVVETQVTTWSIPRTVDLCTTVELDRPSVLGFFAPRILIPEWLFARLTPTELDQLILHETEHLQRRDDWTNLFQKLALVFFPLNPALLWMDTRLSLEREMACDEGVVRKTKAPRAYATCLTNLAERGLQHRSEALSLGAWRQRPELARRIHSILLKKRNLSPAAAATLLVTLGSMMAAGSLELSRCPQLVVFAPGFDVAEARVHSSAVGDGQAPSSTRPRFVQASYNRESSALNARILDLKADVEGPDVSNRRFQHSLFSPKSSQTRVPQEAHLASRLNNIPIVEDASGVRKLSARSVSSTTASVGQPQWIVLTTWEQTLTQPAQGDTLSDFAETQAPYKEGQTVPQQAAANQTADQAGTGENTLGSKANADQRPIYQTTITRLILRVIPSSTFPISADGNPVRSGWLLFKL